MASRTECLTSVCACCAQINLAKVFVVCMAALAIAGTVLTIQQSATGAWDCAAVGN